QPRRNQGGLQGWRARSDSAKAAREQTVQDQSRVRKLAGAVGASSHGQVSFSARRRRVVTIDTAGAVGAADEATSGRPLDGGIADGVFDYRSGYRRVGSLC